MQDIRLTQFFIPVRLQVKSDPENEQVIIDQSIFSWKVEFVRLPFHDALKFAELLELGAKNSTATPVVKGAIGEIAGKSVRALGTGQGRIRLSVKRSKSIAFAVRFTFGLKTQYSWARISAEEARRFAQVLREPNAVNP